MTVVLGISALISYQEKLQAFLADLAAREAELDGLGESMSGRVLPTEKTD